MSGKLIQCFNGKECIYEKCPVFSQEMDTCKMELFKVQVKTTRFKEPESASPEPETQVGGARLISSLKEGEKSSKQNPINLKGTLVFDPQQKDFNRKDGTVGSVTNIVLKDDSGECKITFWDEDGKEIMGFKKGDKLFFDGLYKVDAPYGGKPQLSGGKYFKVAKLN